MRLVRWTQRNPAVAGLSLGMLLLAIGAIIALWTQNLELERKKAQADVNAALALARTGALEANRRRFDEALVAYDGALRAGHPDPASLHIGRARVLLDAGRIDEAGAAIVHARAAGPDVQQSARLRLQSGLLQLRHWPTRAEGIAAVRRARETNLLETVDSLLADSLIAKDSDRARGALNRLLTIDPDHQLANELLTTLLLVFGDPVDLKRQVARFREHFRDADSAPLFLMLEQARLGDSRTARKLLRESGEPKDGITARSARFAIELLSLGRLVDPLIQRAYTGQIPSNLFAAGLEIFGFASAGARLIEAARKIEQPVDGLRLLHPLVTRYLDSLLACFRIDGQEFTATLGRGTAGMLDLVRRLQTDGVMKLDEVVLDEAIAMHPSGFPRFTRGMLRFRTGNAAEAADDLLASLRTADFLHPPRTARLLTMMALQSVGRNDARVKQARAVATELLFSYELAADELMITLDAASSLGLTESARVAAAQVLARFPESLQAEYVRLHQLLDLGAPEQVMKRASKLLRNHPGDHRLQGLIQRANEHLRRR